jgi:hypothetical protein
MLIAQASGLADVPVDVGNAFATEGHLAIADGDFSAVSLSGSLVRGEVAGGPLADFIDQFDRRTPVEGLGVK